MRGRGNRFHSSGCGQIWWMAQGLIGGYHQAGRHTEKEEEEIMRQLKYWEGCLGETRRRSTEPRLTFSLLQDLFKTFFEYIGQSFHLFLTGQQSSQLRSLPALTEHVHLYTPVLRDGILR